MLDAVYVNIKKDTQKKLSELTLRETAIIDDNQIYFRQPNGFIIFENGECWYISDEDNFDLECHATPCDMELEVKAWVVE
jgi:hypothetical protein